jgi:hypothetical protein
MVFDTLYHFYIGDMELSSTGVDEGGEEGVDAVAVDDGAGIAELVGGKKERSAFAEFRQFGWWGSGGGRLGDGALEVEGEHV